MPSAYSIYDVYFLIVLVAAGMIAAITVWAVPGTDDWIGFAFAIAGVVLALTSIVVAFLS
jgi:hypothetical protein